MPAGAKSQCLRGHWDFAAYYDSNSDDALQVSGVVSSGGVGGAGGEMRGDAGRSLTMGHKNRSLCPRRPTRTPGRYHHRRELLP